MSEDKREVNKISLAVIFLLSCLYIMLCVLYNIHTFMKTLSVSLPLHPMQNSIQPSEFPLKYNKHGSHII